MRRWENSPFREERTQQASEQEHLCSDTGLSGSFLEEGPNS